MYTIAPGGENGVTFKRVLPHLSLEDDVKRVSLGTFTHDHLVLLKLHLGAGKRRIRVQNLHLFTFGKVSDGKFLPQRVDVLATWGLKTD